jgi:hypothetical protein
MSKYFADLSGFTVTGFIDPADDDVPIYDPPGAGATRIINANTVRVVGAAGRLTMTVRRTCKSCNNGWMSQLEVATEPVLAPMFGGSPQLLTDEKARVLATWMLKTSLVASLAFGNMLPPTPYEELYATRAASDRTMVWCAHRPDFSLRLQTTPLQSKASRGSGVHDGLHTTMVLGHAVFGMVTRFGAPVRSPPVVLSAFEQRGVWPLATIRERVWPPARPLSDARLAQWIDPPYGRVPRPI